MSAYVQLMVQLMSNKLTLISHIILNEDYFNNPKLKGYRKNPLGSIVFPPAKWVFQACDMRFVFKYFMT